MCQVVCGDSTMKTDTLPALVQLAVQFSEGDKYTKETVVCKRNIEGHLFQPRKVSGQRKKHVQGFEDQKRQGLLRGVKVIEGSLSTMQKEDTTDLAHNRPPCSQGPTYEQILVKWTLVMNCLQLYVKFTELTGPKLCSGGLL